MNRDAKKPDQWNVYRRKMQRCGLTFGELLQSILGFTNKGSVDALQTSLALSNSASLMRGLHRWVKAVSSPHCPLPHPHPPHPPGGCSLFSVLPISPPHPPIRGFSDYMMNCFFVYSSLTVDDRHTACPSVDEVCGDHTVCPSVDEVCGKDV